MNNRGSVARKDGSWSFRYSYRDFSGKRHWNRRQGFTTKSDAQKALTAAMSAIDAGGCAGSSRITVADYLTRWIDLYERSKSRKLSTASTARTHVAAYIIPRIGTMQLSKVTSQVIENLYADLMETGGTCNRSGQPLAPKTVRNIAGTFHKALSDAVQRGHIARNPADGVNLPRWERPEMHPYDESDVSRFLEYAARDGDPQTALWRVMFATGIRRGELLGLRWTDVDFVAGTITVVQSKVMTAGQVIMTTPKTKAGRRTIGLDSDTVAALALLKNAQDAASALFGSTSFPLVATDLDGREIHPLTATRRFQAISAGAGLRKIRLHDTRHTHSTMMLDHGVPIHTVSRRLGHSKVSTTLDVYAAFMPSADRVAADVIGQVLRDAKRDTKRAPKL